MTLSSLSDSFVAPRDYKELHQQYGKLIAKLLLKHNRIERNAEDLHGYVWVKLLEAQLLERFERYVQRQKPRVLSALEACDLLGVPWPQWLLAMSRFHVGTPHIAPSGQVLVFRVGPWMPTPINMGEFPFCGHLQPNALFAYTDIIHLSVSEVLPTVGQDVQGGILVDLTRSERFKIPGVRVTKAQFKNYLTMAVLNHFANYCRTEDRRHKERPVIPSVHQDEDSPSWEASLPDTKSTDSNTLLSLSEARKMLSSTLHECADGFDLCLPVEEHENKLFELLEDGLSLFQALKQSDLPPRVCRSVLNTVRRPLSDEYVTLV